MADVLDDQSVPIPKNVVCETLYEELDRLTGTSLNEHIRDVYNKFAKDYDEEIANNGYIAHKTCSYAFDVQMKRLFKDGRLEKRIVDAGAGTGVVGQHLKDLGYINIDGLDISQEMLNIARDKGIYKNLICAPLSEKKIEQIETGCYDALISSGTITVGHVKPSAIDEIVRLVKPGGIICFTIRQDALRQVEFGYLNKIEELVSNKKWESVGKELIKYHINPENKDREECFVLTYKVL